jgi:L-ascorbate metabolism protein UlaG (beta-lactamase superfamily)
MTIGHLTVTATAAEHPGSRGPWSRHTGPALGFLITTGDQVIGSSAWFAGDTGLGEFMRELGPIDAALIPVGGWGPTLGLEHLDPARAVEALRRVGARLAVPIHYGTLWPIGAHRLRPDRFAPPGLDFARLVADAGLPARIAVLAHGESVEVPSRSPTSELDRGRG